MTGENMNHLRHALDLEETMIDAETAALGPMASMDLRNAYYAFSNHALISLDIDEHLPSNWLASDDDEQVAAERHLDELCDQANDYRSHLDHGIHS